MPTEMGEGRESRVGQGPVDEGGGQFSLIFHPGNLFRISSFSDSYIMKYADTTPILIFLCNSGIIK